MRCRRGRGTGRGGTEERHKCIGTGYTVDNDAYVRVRVRARVRVRVRPGYSHCTTEGLIHFVGVRAGRKTRSVDAHSVDMVDHMRAGVRLGMRSGMRLGRGTSLAFSLRKSPPGCH